MYSAPSASQRRAPRPRVKKTGSPPTARNARTGELTPPGMLRLARSNSSELRALGPTFRLSVGTGLRVRHFLVVSLVGGFVDDALFLGQRLRLALGLRRKDRRVDLLALPLLLVLGEPFDRGHQL